MRDDFGYSEEDRLGKPYNAKMLKRLYPFAKPYLLLFSASIALIIVITVLDLAVPFVTKVAIDRYIVPDTAITGTAVSKQDSTRIRYYEIDIVDGQKKEVVLKYPSLFVTERNTASIRYDFLNRINTHDLAILRETDVIGVGWCALLLLVKATKSPGVMLKKIVCFPPR